MIGPIPVQAGEPYILPKPGSRVPLSPPFDPPVLKGIKVHPDNPFRFDFILDRGNETSAEASAKEDYLKSESAKLIKYFLAALTVPEKDLWVNLSPYERDRIVPDAFGQTEMGRDLLAQDYVLKQITASLIYPEDEIGKRFWSRVYAEAAKKFGTTDMPVNTFNKVWIVPEKAVVYENTTAGTAYVMESRLKVMLEEDCVALTHNSPNSNNSPPPAGGARGGGQPSTSPRPNPPRGGGENSMVSQIVREILIPQLTTEVNEGKNFAQLRQIYSSLILANWYKRSIKNSILARAYADKNKVSGIAHVDPRETQRIYKLYLEALKKGAYNYVKEETDPRTRQPVPRKYFSGGMRFDFAMGADVMQIKRDIAVPRMDRPDRAMVIETNVTPVDGEGENPVLWTEGIDNDIRAVLGYENLAARRAGFDRVWAEYGIFRGEVVPEDLKDAVIGTGMGDLLVNFILGNISVADTRLISGLLHAGEGRDFLWRIFYRKFPYYINRPDPLLNHRALIDYFREVRPQEPVAILDAGSGPEGAALVALKEEYADAVLPTGINSNLTPEAAAGIPGIRLIKGDIESMPFADGEFDIVIESQVLLYYENLPIFVKILDELMRVLKTGGVFIFTSISKYKEENILGIILENLGYGVDYERLRVGGASVLYVWKRSYVTPLKKREDIVVDIERDLRYRLVEERLAWQVSAIERHLKRSILKRELRGERVNMSGMISAINRLSSVVPDQYSSINFKLWVDLDIDSIFPDGTLKPQTVDQIREKIKSVIDGDSDAAMINTMDGNRGRDSFVPAVNVRSEKAPAAPGGIDLTSDKELQVRGDAALSENGRGITLNIDPLALQRMSNASGIAPEIVTIRPLTDLALFLTGRQVGNP